jgi:biopolymer transport protein ExbD
MKFKRAEEEFSPNLISMTDVVFLLLIFFMVSTSFVDFSRRMDIQLPESKAAEVMGKIKRIIIEMPADQKIYLNGNIVSLKKLEEELKTSVQPKNIQGIKTTVIIKADKRLPYGRVVRVMGICKETGIIDIGIAVK